MTVTTSVPEFAGIVNDTPIDFEAYWQQLARQHLNPVEQQQPETQTERGRRAMQTLIEQALIEQQCAQLGLTITDNELDAAIRQNMGDGVDLQAWLASNGLTETELQQRFRRQMLTSRLFEHLSTSIPVTADQAYIQYILVADSSTARAIVTRLKDGVDFFEAGQAAEQVASMWLVKDHSTLPSGLEQIVFALQPGQMHGPIKTEQGYFIIHLVEKDADRPVDDTTLQQIKQQFFLEWLQQQQAEAKIVINVKF